MDDDDPLPSEESALSNYYYQGILHSDPLAEGQFYEALAGKTGFLRPRIGQQHFKDFFHEGYIRLTQHLRSPKYEERGKIMAFSARFMSSLAKDFKKSRDRRIRRFAANDGNGQLPAQADQIAAPTTSSQDITTLAEFMAAAEEAGAWPLIHYINRLSETDRAILKGHLQQLNQSVIARKLGMSQPNVSVRWRNIREHVALYFRKPFL